MNYYYTLIILLMSLLFACQSYKALDLKPIEIIKEVEESREFSSNKTFNFDMAAKLMSEKNRSLKVLRLKYEKFKSIAAVKTPLPNPSVEFGPSFGSNLAEKTASSAQPFVSIGFSIPLGPRLARNDDVNQARELEAYNNYVIEHRKLFFKLRRAYSRVYFAQSLGEEYRKIEATLNISKNVTMKLIKMGSATRLALSQAKLQISQLKVNRLTIKAELDTALGALTSLINVDTGSLSRYKIELFDVVSMDTTKLKLLLLDNNMDLAVHEMAFHIADGELKLALAEQYPDLNIGFSGENEVGEKKRTFSLPFSIELPLFDKNEQAISAAFSTRQIRLEEYKESLAGCLAQLEQGIVQYENAQAKERLIKNEIVPLSKKTNEDAEKSLKLGSINVLRYLDFVVQNQEYQIDLIESQKEFWEKRLCLEEISGAPLINFSSLKKSLKPMVK